MKKIIMFLFCIMFLDTFCFAGVDDRDCYYADSADQILEWNIKIEELKIVRDDSLEVIMISQLTDYINVADAVDDISGYFLTDVPLPPGTYNRICIREAAQLSFKGCIECDDGKWRNTSGLPDGYGTKADALDALAALDAQPLGFDEAAERYFDVGPWTVEEGKNYSLKILWQVTGTVERDGEQRGVGLLWNREKFDAEEDRGFSGGRLEPTFTLEEID